MNGAVRHPDVKLMVEVVERFLHQALNQEEI